MNLKGTEVKKIMLDKKLSQVELSQHLNLSRQTTNYILNNKQNCDIAVCARIAKFLNVFNEETILTDEGKVELDFYRDDLEYMYNLANNNK